ncbi:MAG: hypothetical protein DRN30_02275 [Thermoplasmata archaeon]|nr:MAG: hypothetical protein DRN30_02275 [Thermoplasmata archaeon]
MSEVKIILDTSKYRRDVNSYKRKVNRKLDRVLDDTSNKVKANQKSTLRRSVVEWTGRLAGSIGIEKSGKTRTISPNTPYANWIERGGLGGFMGYHYIRDSIVKVASYFNRKIKNALEGK